MKIWRVPYPKFGDGPGLERVAAVAARLGVDQRRFGETGAVIVGSNGKGSTAAMTAALLGTQDKNVGLFTSPHLLDLNERFRIGDDDITDAELAHRWSRVEAAIDAEALSEKVGGFEFLFLIAADWFAARGCVHTVWEAGLGGRLDPVRLIEATHVALTSLDLEHTDLLGDTFEKIALEKIAAAPRGAKVSVSTSCLGARAEIEGYCAREGVLLEFVEPFADSLDLPLAGAHQRDNASLAIRLARGVAPGLTDAQASAGFALTRWPGRLEVLENDPLTIIDVGHTPAGVAAALDGFNLMRGARPGVLVCGASRDKDAAALIAALAPAFSTIVCAAARHKGAPVSEIAVHAAAANADAEIVLSDSIADARQIALTRAWGEGAAIYVAGGLFLAAEFKAVHLGRDPAALAFF